MALFMARSVAVLVTAGVLFGPPHPLRTQQAECGTQGDWAGLIRAHLARYPDMEIADLYKLLHQATMGSEHAVPSEEMARAWLVRELDQLSEGPQEPLVDSLGSGGRLARIHLRPFQASGGDPLRLVEALVATAARSYGGRGALRCALELVQNMAALGELPWSAESIRTYVADRARQGYPAVHHSDGYVSRYRPAYRVIALELVPQVLGQ